MRAATGDFDFLDGGAATWAGLTLPVENLCKKFEIVAFGAVGFDVGSHSGTAGGDGSIHDVAGGLEEFGGFLSREGTGSSLGVDARREEGLVGINVAKAGDDGLVEDSGFNQRILVALQFVVEFVWRHHPRFFGEFLDEGVLFDCDGG